MDKPEKYEIRIGAKQADMDVPAHIESMAEQMFRECCEETGVYWGDADPSARNHMRRLAQTAYSHLVRTGEITL